MPSSAKRRMKPPGSASTNASSSSCTAWSFSLWACRACACSTITLSCISPRQFQTSEQDFTGNDSIGVFDQPRQVEALLCVLRSFLQVVPFVADASQPQVRFAGTRLRRLTHQVQDAPVGLGCCIQLVV